MNGEICRIGFDIGGTNIACGLIDDEYAVKKTMSCGFEPVGEAGIAKKMYAMANEICIQSGIALESIGSIGICIPGSVDTKNGIVIDAYNLGLHDSPFRRIAANRFNKSTALLNDADAAALAEARLGALKRAENSMLITIGTGIGAGIILGGKLFHGGRGMGVEAGHVQMNLQGEACTCGRNGCIETLCSASWLEYRAKHALGENASAKMLVDMAKEGVPVCREIWNEYSCCLGNAIASYINILDPQLIALGGGVSGAGQFLIDSIRAYVDKGSFFRKQTPIVLAQMGNDAGMIGACIYASENP